MIFFKQQNMETEIIVALIASFVSLILGIKSIISSRKISLKQNEIELKKIKIEILENRRKRLEEVKISISSRESNVIKLDSLEDLGKLTVFFTKNFKDVLTISHLIDKEFTENLSNLLKKIEEHSGREKTGMNVDYNEAFEDAKEMSRLNQLIPIVLGRELENVGKDISKLLM